MILKKSEHAFSYAAKKMKNITGNSQRAETSKHRKIKNSSVTAIRMKIYSNVRNEKE